MNSILEFFFKKKQNKFGWKKNEFVFLGIYSSLMRVLFLPIVVSVHVLYQQTVSLIQTTALLPEHETIPLNFPVAVIPNNRYAMTLEFHNASITRKYLGATLLNSAQCALVHVRYNSSFAIPVGGYPSLLNTFDFYLQVNADYQTMTTVLATTVVTSPIFIDPEATGFGQTFASGSQSSLNMITLYLAAGTTSTNAV